MNAALVAGLLKNFGVDPEEIKQKFQESLNLVMSRVNEISNGIKTLRVLADVNAENSRAIKLAVDRLSTMSFLCHCGEVHQIMNPQAVMDEVAALHSEGQQSTPVVVATSRGELTNGNNGDSNTNG